MDAIVAGSGPELVKELEEALRCLPGAKILAVNYTAFFLPRADYLCSLHLVTAVALKDLWRERDWCVGNRDLPAVVGPSPHPGVDEVFKPEQGIAGTSALYAVRFALQRLKSERVLLAGVPMDASGRFYDALIPLALGRPILWPHENDRPAWEAAMATEFTGRVKSLGGWTAERLGTEWT